MRLRDFEDALELQKYKIKSKDEGQQLIADINEKMKLLLTESVDKGKDNSNERYELKKARGFIYSQLSKIVKDNLNV